MLTLRRGERREARCCCCCRRSIVIVVSLGLVVVVGVVQIQLLHMSIDGTRRSSGRGGKQQQLVIAHKHFGTLAYAERRRSRSRSRRRQVGRLGRRRLIASVLLMLSHQRRTEQETRKLSGRGEQERLAGRQSTRATTSIRRRWRLSGCE